MSSWCSEPPMGLTVLRPLSGAACSPTWLEPLLSDGVVSRLLAGLPPIVALRSPLREGLTLVGDHPCASTEVNSTEGKRPTVEGSEASISLEGGVGSSPIASPPFTKVISDIPAMVTLSFHEEDLE